MQGKRYFEGQIWVDDRDLQIVKTYGKGVGRRQGDDQYPKFETYREQIDGKYWFPLPIPTPMTRCISRIRQFVSGKP